jgi:hypothetical protein
VATTWPTIPITSPDLIPTIPISISELSHPERFARATHHDGDKHSSKSRSRSRTSRSGFGLYGKLGGMRCGPPIGCLIPNCQESPDLRPISSRAYLPQVNQAGLPHTEDVTDRVREERTSLTVYSRAVFGNVSSVCSKIRKTTGKAKFASGSGTSRNKP